MTENDKLKILSYRRNISRIHIYKEFGVDENKL